MMNRNIVAFSSANYYYLSVSLSICRVALKKRLESLCPLFIIESCVLSRTTTARVRRRRDTAFSLCVVKRDGRIVTFRVSPSPAPSHLFFILLSRQQLLGNGRILPFHRSTSLSCFSLFRFFSRFEFYRQRFPASLVSLILSVVLTVVYVTSLVPIVFRHSLQLWDEDAFCTTPGDALIAEINMTIPKHQI